MSFNLDNFYKGSNQCKKCRYNKTKCEHNKIKRQCRDCNGSSFCEHNIRKSVCKECKGSSICEHDKIRNSCRQSNGSAFCEHNKERNKCVICHPSCACQQCKSIIINKTTQYYPLCQACFCNKYPDHEKSTLYKIKEHYLRDELRLRFPDKDINMIFDKAVDG
jgi:hypothetical protein